MKLSQCKIGEIVCSMNSDGTIDQIGHIVGLSHNNYGEVIPLIKWSDIKKPQAVHHRNISTLEQGEKNAEKVKQLKETIN